MRSVWVLFLLILIPVLAIPTESEFTWKKAGPGHDWEFPRDHHLHPDYKTEWWYITGHLSPVGDPDAEPFGYQLTFFRSGLAPADSLESGSAWQPVDLIMGHAAVSDPGRKEHTFSEVLRRTTPFLGGFGAPGDTTLAWCRAPAGTDADWRLSWKDGAYRLEIRDDVRGLRYELECRPTREELFHGDDGFSPKTQDGTAGSLYFSQTRMATTGALYRDGQPVTVQGESWLDREIFTSTLSGDQKGWDWLALRMKDGRDVMLYRLRDEAGQTDFALGSLRRKDGTIQAMTRSRWSLEPQDHWTSAETGSRYPVSWKLTLAGAPPWLIEAAFPDQENVSPRTGIHYWEGSVRVSSWEDRGRLLGRGFVELTGYGEGSRPPI